MITTTTTTNNNNNNNHHNYQCIYISIATVNKHDSSILQVARLGEEAPARPLIDKYVGHIYLPMYIYIYIYIYVYMYDNN